jgi:hypothetical protein
MPGETMIRSDRPVCQYHDLPVKSDRMDGGEPTKDLADRGLTGPRFGQWLLFAMGAILFSVSIVASLRGHWTIGLAIAGSGIWTVFVATALERTEVLRVRVFRFFELLLRLGS